MSRIADYAPAFVVMLCVVMIAGGAVAWSTEVVDAWRRRQRGLAAPDRSVFREGSIERFREELRNGAALPKHDEMDFGDDTLPAFVRRQAD